MGDTPKPLPEGAPSGLHFFSTVLDCAYSGEELARRTGCTRQTIIALEQGNYVPSIKLAFGLARAFGVTIEEVFQYGDTE